MQMFHDQNRAKWIKLADEVFISLPTSDGASAHLDITKKQAIDLIGQGATYSVTIYDTGTISVMMDS